MKKRILSLALVLTFLLSIFMLCSTAFAATGGENVLSAELKTDKLEYAAGEEIKISLALANQSAYKIQNIRTQLVLPSGLNLTAGTLAPEAFALGAGEDKTLDYSAELPGVKITQQPQTVAVALGETATVTVGATGDGLSYKWYIKNAGKNYYGISSVTTNTYSVTMSETVRDRQLYCVVTDQYGNTAKTDVVYLRATNPQLAITQQPQSVAVALGETATVTVGAEGEGLSYKWYIKNAGKNYYGISSVTTNTYSVTMSETVRDRQLYCLITDQYGNTVKTEVVYLRATNPKFAITQQPQTTYTKQGDTVTVTVGATGDGLTYKWYIKNAGKNYYGLSSVTSNTYTVKMAATVKDRQIYCVVTDQYGNTVKTDTVYLRMAVTITEQPETGYAGMGETVEVTVGAVGDGLTYKWYVKNAGKNYFGISSVTSNTYTVEMSSTSKDRQIYCVITDQYGNRATTDTVYLREGMSTSAYNVNTGSASANGAAANSSEGPAATGDVRLYIYGALAVLSLAGLVAVCGFKGLLKNRWFIIVLCLALLIPVLGPVAARAESFTDQTLAQLDCQITVAGQSYTISATVTYDYDTTEEVAYKQDGTFLYAPVAEKGYYTGNGTTYDGWKSSATERHEVVAFYLDTLFGAERFTTGNVTAAGEFTQDIFNDDAQQQILLGRTEDPASLKALKLIEKDEWIIVQIDGKLVVTGWFDNATAAAARHLYDLVVNAADQDNVTLTLPIKGSVDGFTTDIPDLNAVSNATFLNGADSDDGVLLLRYNNVDADDFDTYCTAMESAGYTVYQENEILNYGEAYNLFATFVKDEDVVHVMYLPNAFMTADQSGMTQPESDALTRGFRPDGNELRIITDKKANLFTNEETNSSTIYDYFGIGPKYSLVNLTVSASDGNDIGALDVFTLSDGSFIVVDGGSPGDATQVYKSLKALNERPDEKIIVAAWILTHDHGDHTGAFKALAESEYAQEITIEQIIYNDTSKNYMWRQENSVGYANSGLGVNIIDSRTESVMPALIAKFNGDTQFVHPHMGQKMYIRNAEIEFFYSGDDDMFPVAIANYNSTALVPEVTLGGQEFLLLGDACQDVSHFCLIPLYSQAVQCDILEVAHHGLGGQTSKIYGLTKASTGLALWHTSWRSALRNEYGPVFYRGTNELMQKMYWPRDEFDLDGDGKKDESVLSVEEWFFDNYDAATAVPNEVPATGGYMDPLGRYDYSKMVENPYGYIDLNLVADDFIQVINLPYTMGDTIDKVKVDDYDTTLYSVEDVKVAFLPAFHFRSKFDSKYDGILAQFKSYDADVLILTQADHESTLYPNGDIVNRLLEDLDFAYAHYTPVWKCDANADMTTGVGTAGHLVLSRYPIVDAQDLDLGNTQGGTVYKTAAEGGYTEGRGTCYVQLDVEGMLLDVFATHFANANNWADFKTQLEENATGDFWMIVGQTQIQGNAETAATKLGLSEISDAGISGAYNIFGSNALKFKGEPVVDPAFQSIVASNMNDAYVVTAELSHYAASDACRETTPGVTDFMAWTVNNYGTNNTHYNTIIGELTYVHPEIAVLIMVDDIRQDVTPAEVAAAAGYPHYEFVEAWTYNDKATVPEGARSRGSLILSDLPLDRQDDLILVADGTSREGRAYGHVIVNIDGVDTDIWFGFHDTDMKTEDFDDATTEENQITRLNNAVKAVADATGRPFIVYGQSGDFATTNTSFAGKDVTDVSENVEKYICALSGTNVQGDPLTVSDFYAYDRTVLGITVAQIGDQYWMTFGAPFNRYELNVENGSGDGKFRAGKEIEVTASKIKGKEFTGWTAEGLTLTPEQAAASTMTITMPEGAVTLTATYKDVPILDSDPLEETVSFKVGSMMTYRFSNKYFANAAGINNILAEYDLDVIALEGIDQNASGYNNKDVPGLIAEGVKSVYPHAYYGPYWDNNNSNLGSGTAGHLVLSKHPIVHSNYFTYYATAANEDRGLVHVVVQVAENTNVDIFVCAVDTADTEMPAIAEIINRETQSDYWFLVGSHKTTANGAMSYLGQTGITSSTNTCTGNRSILAGSGVVLSDSDVDWDSNAEQIQIGDKMYTLGGKINQLIRQANPAEMHWATATVHKMGEPKTKYGVYVNDELVDFYAAGESVTLTTPAAEVGYVFDGWTKPDSVILDDPGDLSAQTISFVMPAAPEGDSLHFTASYSAVPTATVTFNANGGTGTMTAVQKNQGESYALPACTIYPPTGKTFAGWSVNGGEMLRPAGYEISITEDVVLTANWADYNYPVLSNPVAADPTVKVTSWYGVGRTNVKAPLDQVANYLKTEAYGADIVLLPHITNVTADTIDDFAALAGYPYYVFAEADANYVTGHAIISKYPVTLVDTLTLVQAASGTEGRSFLYATVYVNGSYLDVVLGENNGNNNPAIGQNILTVEPWVENLTETRKNSLVVVAHKINRSGDTSFAHMSKTAFGTTQIGHGNEIEISAVTTFAPNADDGNTAFHTAVSGGYTTLTFTGKRNAVIFDANGGGSTMDTLYLPDGTYELPECTFTAPTGHEFDYWSVGDVKITGSAELTENVTVVANWKPIVSSVTVTDGTGSGDYAYGATVTITATKKDGFKFSGEWTKTPAGLVLTPGEADSDGIVYTYTFTMPAEDVTLAAVYEGLYSVTVTGGTVTGGQTTFTVGTEVTLTATVPERYAFTAWTGLDGVTFLDGTNVNSATVKFTMPSGNLTVNATFTQTVGLVTLNANDGTDAKTSEQVTIGNSYTLPECTFTAPTGKYFAGWAETANGAVITDTSITVTEDTTLYAVWNPLPTLKLASASTYAYGGGTKVSSNLTAITEAMKTYDADVITLMGVHRGPNKKTTEDQYTLIKTAMAQDYPHAYFAPVWDTFLNEGQTADLETGEGCMGHMILSKYPIIFEEAIYLSTDTDTTAEKRGVGHVILNVKGVAVDVFFGHMKSNANWKNEDLKASIAAANDAWIVTGNIYGSYDIATELGETVNKAYVADHSVVVSGALSFANVADQTQGFDTTNVTNPGVVSNVTVTLPAPKTVKFSANDGTEIMTRVMAYGTYTLPECTFDAPEGKYFAGWANSADGNIISGETINVTKDTTFYAVWWDEKIDTVTVGSFPTNRFLTKYTTNAEKIKAYLLSQYENVDVMAITNIDNAIEGAYNKYAVADDLISALYTSTGEEGKYPYCYFAKAWNYNDAGSATTNEGWLGHLIFSKYPIVQKQSIVQLDQADAEDRGAGYVTLAVGNRTLDVFFMNNVSGTTNWTSNSNALLYAVKASTADGWVALGNTGLNTTNVSTLSGTDCLNETLSASYDQKDPEKRAWILAGSDLTLGTVTVLTDVADSTHENYVNYYQWHIAPVTFN